MRDYQKENNIRVQLSYKYRQCSYSFSGSFKNLFHEQDNTALTDQKNYYDIKANITLEQCAHLCLLSSRTACMSFSYSKKMKACGLSNKYHSNTGRPTAAVMKTSLYVHYQYFTCKLIVIFICKGRRHNLEILKEINLHTKIQCFPVFFYTERTDEGYSRNKQYALHLIFTPVFVTIIP